MTLSLTDWLQQNRLVVVSVDAAAQRVRLKSSADACTDFSCAGQTVIVSEADQNAGLGALNAGDIVRLDGGTPGHPDRIVIVRRVWEELTSPEF